MTSKEQLKALYNNLPDAIKAVYDRPETNDEIYEICEKHKLHIDQIGVVINTAYAAMLGVVKPSDFTDTFTKKADIPSDIANIITHEINEQVFAPIRQELMHSGNTWSTGSGPKPLPNNVEPISPQFSSVPYQPARPEDPVKQEILTAIENPSPTQMITRDNFADKLGQLSQNKESSQSLTRPIATKPVEKKKLDPYREPLV
ncbi:MAG: hypothetical protein AAB900_01330 [Patescibacteria group bacterium]